MAAGNSEAKCSKAPDPNEWEFSFVFETYGVTVKIDSNDEAILNKVKAITKKSFLGRLEFIDNATDEEDYRFGLRACDDHRIQLFENGLFRSEDKREAVVLGFFTSYLRAVVAERANPWVFIHAGVVGRNGRAILVPGSSYSGKTTLVADLIRKGADYYSDEYAVLDESGLVHPYPRDLSIRVDGNRLEVKETKPTELAGSVGIVPLEVGLVVVTHYVPESKWSPERLTIGNGIKELVAHTISIRFNPLFGMKVLNAALENAIIIKGQRGDSAQVAENLLSILDDDSNWS
jgi:hypothetical protein